MMDTKKLSLMIEDFVRDREWDQFHSVKNLSMALSVETSELLELFQWMPEAESNLISNDPRLKLRVAEELADILYYLLRLSRKTGIDLEEALESKMVANAEKYPVELARGNSKKYDQL
jgi:dCTP diphosphatase